MLKPISEVVGAKLVDLENSQTIGRITDWIIDPQQKKISALVVKLPGIFRGVSIITTIDVIEYGPGIVVVRDQNAVVSPNEVIGLKKLIKSRQRIIGSRVETKSGKLLGNVEDLIFETVDSILQKLYVKPGILGMVKQPDRIISADKIIKIEPKRIVVQDNVMDMQTNKLAQVIT